VPEHVDPTDFAFVVCALGLLVSTLVLASRRWQFCVPIADYFSNWPDEGPRPVRLVAFYAGFAIVQLLIDLALVFYFARAFWTQWTSSSPSDFLDLMGPLWAWISLGLLRIAIEFPLRALERRLKALI
jgi:hypothetical protein